MAVVLQAVSGTAKQGAASSPRAFAAADPVAFEVDGDGVGASVRGSHRLQGPANPNTPKAFRLKRRRKEGEKPAEGNGVCTRGPR